MKWLRIQDYILPLDKILYVNKDELDDDFVIYVKLTTEECIHFFYPSEKERDEAFETICKQLQW